ncbi:MAG: adenylosuccinate lyase [Candidatus Omnitrophica bacterium]|nr:adenylosuccinate lyase [Candidatus Omnitrophota bacterium]MBU1048212.1 adenylosuccinate lyase [Candidatus Omnitrophota bacterium]MBU1631344.1 adenylosuccinate lyase [Candidatus Omnitrophota bacterium]MBU1889728.1 adenylosuccinate lyase [Candidatus Omnitrophota bacterium]
MIKRYTFKEMGDIWDEKNRYAKWLEVELAACDEMQKEGLVPKGITEKIKKKAKVNLDMIHAFEKSNNHEVIAFLDSLAKIVGDEAKYIHLGLTSSDIMDTGLALQMKDASKIILKDLDVLITILKKQALKHRNTVMIGRTHGIHAQPITLGLKFALWWEEIKRNRLRFENAMESISYGKISGAVGTFTHTSPKLEESTLNKLGLKPEPIATQVVQRDRHAQFLLTLALISSSIEKFALEIRHLQRTEVREAEEPFGKTQKGSSAMPHKRNPILCERICGLARIIKSNGIVSLENIPLWHERDISHSSAERVIIPDSCILIDYILQKFIFVIENLSIFPARMKQNLAISGGLIYSQKIVTALINKGMNREKAYNVVQKYALESYDTKKDFKSLICKDKEINKRISKKELDVCFDFSSLLKNVNKIFQRLGIEK